MGQRWRRSRHGELCRHRHPSLVAADGFCPLSRCQASYHHRRRGRQQWSAAAAVEGRTAEARGRTRSRHHRLPSAARHQQVEQDRAPPLLVHYPELARQAARQPPNHRSADRCYPPPKPASRFIPRSTPTLIRPASKSPTPISLASTCAAINSTVTGTTPSNQVTCRGNSSTGPKFAFALPVLPGKDAHSPAVYCRGNKDAHRASRKRAGITMERVYLMASPMGSFAVAYVESTADFATTFGSFTKGDPFDKGFIDRLQDEHGIDLSKPPPQSPEVVGDWSDPSVKERRAGLA